MFTGIITDVGTLVSRDQGRFRIRSAYPAAGIALGVVDQRTADTIFRTSESRARFYSGPQRFNNCLSD